MPQQPGFSLYPATIAGEGTIRSDHAVTGHNDSDGICTIGGANRPNRVRASDSLREFRVRDGFATFDGSQCMPYLFLERCSRCLYR